MSVLDFDRTFGKNSNTSNRQDKPAAQVWMNIGYTVQVETEAGTEDRFVSIPMGVAIDTMEPIKMPSGNNESFRQFRAAQNALLQQLQEAGAELKPGEERTVNLEIQLRRVAEAAAAPATDETNPFVRKLG